MVKSVSIIDFRGRTRDTDWHMPVVLLQCHLMNLNLLKQLFVSRLLRKLFLKENKLLAVDFLLYKENIAKTNYEELTQMR
jgi:hypothetical protein